MSNILIIKHGSLGDIAQISGAIQDIKENHVEDVIARRISQRLQLDSVKINFSAPGDSSREVGDLISFDFPTENSKVAATSGRGAGHKYYSGKFLITSLRHKITQDEYTIHVEAIKDGYKSAISSGFEELLLLYKYKIQELDYQ